jgi:hypothetical protein
MTRDLELAKRKLKENGLTLAIVKDSKVLFESKSRGVSGFLEARAASILNGTPLWKIY